MIQEIILKSNVSFKTYWKFVLSLYPENPYWWSAWCLHHAPEWNFSYTPYYTSIMRSLNVYRTYPFWWSISRISGNRIIDVSCKGYSDNRLADADYLHNNICWHNFSNTQTRHSGCGKHAIMDTSCCTWTKMHQ